MCSPDEGPHPSPELRPVRPAARGAGVSLTQGGVGQQVPTLLRYLGSGQTQAVTNKGLTILDLPLDVVVAHTYGPITALLAGPVHPVLVLLGGRIVSGIFSALGSGTEN